VAARCTATDQAIEACGGDPRAAAAAAAGVKFFIEVQNASFRRPRV